MNDKNISHIHLLDALEKSQICPLCDLTNASIQKYINDMLYESVNDPGLREKLAKNKGFCGLHGNLILKHGDALGIAMLHIDQIQILLDHLDSVGRFYSKITKYDHTGWTEHAGCIICELMADVEKRHIEVFINLIDDNVMRNYLETFSGFCARHFFRVFEKLNNPEHKKYLLNLHVGKYKSLLADLKEFCRKNDYRFRNEPSGKEADSWQKAIYVISGKTF
ncbi:MAG: hypothetical protein JW808_05550 [Victivallales bacterium]|nr:hypothetical protein [Victivallales bacterium]